MALRPRVLIVDDEAFVRDSLSETLRAEGFEAEALPGAAEALRLLERRPFDAIVTDLRMPSVDGLALLEEARRRRIAVPILVITGVGTVADAVAAMKAGAWDLLQKPVDPEELVLLVRRAVEHRKLASEVERLREAVGAAPLPRRLAGSSAAIEHVRALVAQVAPTDATVLVTGESGAGKEVVAEEIHRASPRAEAPLVRVACAALPVELFEGELFGHKKGAVAGAIADRAGRFAEAEGGTLVLDEVAALPPASQARLLRVLESREYQVAGEERTRVADVRVIATTNEDLASKVESEVGSGAFRRDLWFRLNVFPIAVPPLRQHKEDLAEIVADLLDRHGPGWRDRPGAGPTPGALEVLSSYDWPGNVRELRNVLERAVILSGDAPLDAALFRSVLESAPPARAAAEVDELHLRRALDAREKELLQKALARSEGRKKEAATLLGIDPRNLGYYLRKHRLSEGPGEAGGR